MKRSIFQVISAILLIVGLIFLLKSVSMGQSSANAYLRANGGSMDTSRFMVVLQEYISVYKIFGAVLALIGGFGIQRSIKILEENKPSEEN